MTELVKRHTHDFTVTPVEKMYQEHLNQLSGMEKMLKAQSLNQGMWEMLSCLVRLEEGGLSDRELHYLVAKRVYINDRQFLKIIESYYNGY
jgi:hypothetical protein